MDQKAKRNDRIISGISYALLAAVAAYLVYCAVKGNTLGINFGIMMSVVLALFWFLQDVISPRVTHRMEGRTKEQVDAFTKFILLDLAGYAGLAFFAFSIGESGNKGIYGAVVFACCLMYKKKYLRIFNGEDPDGEKNDEQDGENHENVPSAETVRQNALSDAQAAEEEAPMTEVSPEENGLSKDETVQEEILSEETAGNSPEGIIKDHSEETAEEDTEEVSEMPRYWKR